MKEKVMEFAKKHWDDLATLGIFAVTEYAMYRAYQAYLKKSLDKFED